MGDLPTSPSQVVDLQRRAIAERYLTGQGVEVGAGGRPFPVPQHARVSYGDIRGMDAIQEYFKTADVRSDSAIDGQTFAGIANDSLDFVISAHVIEHLRDPIGSIVNAIRVLRPGGIHILVVPDMRFTFDNERPVSTNTFYQTVAREINQACDEGRVPSRLGLSRRVERGSHSEHDLGQARCRRAKSYRGLLRLSFHRSGLGGVGGFSDPAWFRSPLAGERAADRRPVSPRRSDCHQARLLFFSFLDAAWWMAGYERYVFPIMPLSACFFILLIYEAWFVCCRPLAFSANGAASSKPGAPPQDSD